jgi:hypothetical protein
VGVVGYLLGTGLDLLPYKYKGVWPIENPEIEVLPHLQDNHVIRPYII